MSGISFWEDLWIGENPLSSTYPRLLQIVNQIGRKVGDIGAWNAPIWEWRKDCFDWEKSIVEEFL